MHRSLIILTAAIALAACVARTGSDDTTVNSRAERGALLYDTACGDCHTTQPHWREKRLVHTCAELTAQVTRWQRVAGQNWTSAEISDVAAYLNRRFYRLSCAQT